MRMLGYTAIVLVTIASLAAAQAVTFTGDVTADFPGNQLMIDPGGADVGMPPNLAANTSGWDIRNLAISYDEQTDILFVGLDFAGIAGDADGDGDPGTSSAPLLVNGGVDLPDMLGSEGFAFAMDLDDDGLLDFVAGIPLGADINGFTVATYANTVTGNGSLSPTTDPYSRFGTTLPANIGTLFASPSAAAPDIEFTIPNFSDLIAQFGMGSDGQYGVFEVYTCFSKHRDVQTIAIQNNGSFQKFRGFFCIWPIALDDFGAHPRLPVFEFLRNAQATRKQARRRREQCTHLN